MSHWLDDLRDQLQQRSDAHLLRQLRPVDRCARLVHHHARTLINFAGNDYLALASHPKLIAAVCDTAHRLGVGAGASRLVTGHLQLHAEVEARFAAFKHAEAALICPTGYAANFAVLTALAGPDDLVCLDKLNHASLLDGSRASSGNVRYFFHRNYDKLARLLQRSSHRRRFIITDTVFSMDGDCADLPILCELRDRYDAVLIIDEAHGTGVLGDTGSGLAEAQGVADRIDVTISTASKALGSLGGIVTGPRVVIDTLVNSARGFIYTTAVPPTQAAAIGAALDVIRDEPERRVRLRALSRRLREQLRAAGWDVPLDDTPIVPLILGDPAAALALSEKLASAGFLIPAIRPPTVPPGSSRLRLSLRCDLLDEDVDRVVEVIGAKAARKHTGPQSR